MLSTLQCNVAGLEALFGEVVPDGVTGVKSAEVEQGKRGRSDDQLGFVADAK